MYFTDLNWKDNKLDFTPFLAVSTLVNMYTPHLPT